MSGGVNDRPVLGTGDQASSSDALLAIVARWRLILFGAMAAGLVALGVTYLIPQTFTSRLSFLPPQQQGSTAQVLASVSALASVAGAAAGVRTPADQYVALLQSTTVIDALVTRFELQGVYDVKLRMDARRELGDNTRVGLSRRDGLVSVEVDDRSPQRAADIANAYLEELRKLTSRLALSEAQQRRAFFEQQLKQTRDRLTAAQIAMQSSGFNAGALKAEPRAAAEAYARLRADLTVAEVRLQASRGALVDTAPEVVQQQATVSALRGQLARVESAGDREGGPDYVSKYREFKYQETLFDLFARQYELARADEAREGLLFQIIDTAQPAEKKSRPKRALTALVATFVAGAVLLGWALLAHALRSPGSTGATRWSEMRRALRGR
jgi:uncharacterized protein involved in exopolysaccharide biosynthesis